MHGKTRPFVIAFASLAASIAGGLASAHPRLVAILQDEHRERAPEEPGRLRGCLVDAIQSLAAAQEEAFTVLGGIDRQPTPTPVQLEFLARLKAELPEALAKELESTGRALELRDLLDMHFHALGHLAFLRARNADPTLRPADLEPLASAAFLAGEPVAEFGLPEEVAKGARSSDVRGIPNLCGRLVLYGALRCEDFFATETEKAADGKAAFIARLLVAGQEAEAPAFVVSSALEPPMSEAGKVDGKEVLPNAAGDARRRGKVGFREEHLEFLASLRTQIAAERTAARRAAKPDPYERYLPMGLEDSHRVRSPRGFLPEWAAMLQQRAQDELHPGVPLAASVDDPATALDEWRALAEQSWAAYWEKAAPFVLDLITGGKPHGHDARIAQLEAMAQGGALDAESAAELKRLKDERRDDRITLAKSLLELFGDVAPPDEGLRALIGLMPKVEASRFDGSTPGLFRDAFAAVSYRDAPRCADWLQAELDGAPGSGLPDVARQLMIQSVIVSAARVPGAASTLERIALAGSDVDRAAVLIATSPLPPERAEATFDQAISDCLASGKSRPELQSSVLQGLYNRGRMLERDGRPLAAEPWIVETLVSTFDRDGRSLWTGSPQCEEATLRWIARALPEADFARLAAAGRLPEAILKHR